jgi:hypothetical protein
MRPGHSNDPADSWLWQVTDAAPTGEWINFATPKPSLPVRIETATLPEASDTGWLMSSFELASGSEVREDEIDTVPVPLLEHLFFAPTGRD